MTTTLLLASVAVAAIGLGIIVRAAVEVTGPDRNLVMGMGAALVAAAAVLQWGIPALFPTVMETP